MTWTATANRASGILITDTLWNSQVEGNPQHLYDRIYEVAWGLPAPVASATTKPSVIGTQIGNSATYWRVHFYIPEDLREIVETVIIAYASSSVTWTATPIIYWGNAAAGEAWDDNTDSGTINQAMTTDLIEVDVSDCFDGGIGGGDSGILYVDGENPAINVVCLVLRYRKS